MAWGYPDSAHLVVYDPVQVASVISFDQAFYGIDVKAAVRWTCERGQNGELLGYGVRSMEEAGMSVQFHDSDGQVRAGFWGKPDDFEEFVDERLKDYVDALNCDWKPRIRQFR